MRVTSQDHLEQANRAVLERWYQRSGNAERLRQQIAESLSDLLEQVFGYHTVVLGPDIGLNIALLAKTQRVVHLTTEGREQGGPQVVGTSYELPFACDSIDALILCHALETSPVPHQVLRECQRVLVPNGHLFALTLNPFSLNGLLRTLGNGFRRRYRGVVRPLSSYKLNDWLSLLSFSFAEPRHHLVLPALARGRIRNWMNAVDRWLFDINAPLGSVCLTHARKRVSAHLGTRERAVTRPKLIPIPVGKAHDGVTVPRQPSLRFIDPGRHPK